MKSLLLMFKNTLIQVSNMISKAKCCNQMQFCSIDNKLDQEPIFSAEISSQISNESPIFLQNIGESSNKERSTRLHP